MKTFFLFLAVLQVDLFASNQALMTLGETSQFKQTGRYVEAERLCKAFASRFPSQVDCITFGTTPEGRKMRALIVGDSKRALFPGWVKRKGRPVIYFQGGIHAGEIDGKDAGFWLIRQILEKEANPKLIEALKNVTLVFVPVFNVDGHERFGKNNRPNQVGPEEMGWRTTSQNYNLNRDYMKVDSPEMAALLKLIQKWDPVVGVDLHVTDGAQFQTEVALIMEPIFQGAQELREMTSSIQNTLIQKLKSRGHLAVDFYPSFRKEDDPSTGFERYVAQPRFSQGYWGLLNRVGILVETHSWKDYATRVKVTRDTLEELILLAAEKGQAWRRVMNEIDKSSLVGTSEGLSFDTSDKNHEIEFPGYKYHREDSEISGGTKITYFPNQPEVWKVPLYDDVKATVVAKIPEGYVIPKSFAPIVIPKLKIHGIKFKEVVDDVGEKELETFRADSFSFANKSFEGHQGLTVKGDWKSEKVMVMPGDIFVSTRQPRALLVFHLFEPKGPDSFLSWGFFNTRFEQKEYMESYIAEEVAQEMLKNIEVKKDFDKKLEDSEFEKSPEKRLQFFHQKHPSWDKNFGLYPIYKSFKPLK